MVSGPKRFGIELEVKECCWSASTLSAAEGAQAPLAIVANQFSISLAEEDPCDMHQGSAWRSVGVILDFAKGFIQGNMIFQGMETDYVIWLDNYKAALRLNKNSST